ncbi:MAG: hypothetical protein ACPH5P_00140 [Akkermansiaceae bacterium]
MKLTEALALPSNSSIPSISFNIVNHICNYVNERSTCQVYNINDDHSAAPSVLRLIRPHDKDSLSPGTYTFKAAVSAKGLQGINIVRKHNYAPYIKIDEHITTENMNTTTPASHAPLNDKEALMNYFGKTYLDMRTKAAAAPGVTDEQAHEIALEFLGFIPKSFFGEKQLP